MRFLNFRLNESLSENSTTPVCSGSFPKKFLTICPRFRNFLKAPLGYPNEAKYEKQDDLLINGPLFRLTVRNMASSGGRVF